MRGLGLILVASVAVGLVQTPAFGQTLLEQLEQKVRENLELTAPAEDAKPAEAGAAAQPVAGEQLPSPKKTPPPPPSPSATPGARASSSILEAASAKQDSGTPSVAADADATSGIYLGLEAESLTGGGIGARVVGITENSPAWRAGFKVGDVILGLDGYAIANLDSMVERLAPHRPGDSIKALVLRGGRNVELTAVLQSAALAQQIQNGAGAAPAPASVNGAPAWVGLAVADLSTAFRNQFNLRVSRAAAVTSVTKGSPADAAGIQVGDAIVSADGRKIESARDWTIWFAKRSPGDRISLTVMRGTRTTTFDLALMADPKTAPQPPRKPVVSESSAPPSATGDLSLGEYADTTVGRAVIENTVPPPPGAELSELEQLREELRAAREQIGALEQRLGELENRLPRQPQ